MTQKLGWLAITRRRLRDASMRFRRFYFNRLWGMHLGEDAVVSFSAKLDKTNPRGIWIGKDTAVSFRAAILSHDYVRRLYLDTRIGERCQIGAHSIVMPGVTIGDGCVVAAGSVVMRDVPPNSMVFGNPARVMESGITTGKWGMILGREAKPQTQPATQKAE